MKDLSLADLVAARTMLIERLGQVKELAAAHKVSAFYNNDHPLVIEWNELIKAIGALTTEIAIRLRQVPGLSIENCFVSRVLK